MEEQFAFTAPQRIDITEENVIDVEEGDSYFEVDHEHEGEVFIPNEPLNHSTYYVRRSMSTGDLLELQQIQAKHSEPEYSSNDNLDIDVANMHISTEDNRNLNPGILSRRCNSANRVNSHIKQVKFVSMAEGIRKVHMSTPERFRLNKTPILKKHLLTSTIPHSPALCSKNRKRPVNYLTQSEKEDLEVKAMQEYQIKAQPINPKVMAGPSNLKYLPRIKKNETSANCKLKSALQPPIKLKNTTKSGRTIPQPFSFEKRNQEIMRRKEDKIKEFIEAENKLREFHASKVPPYIKSNSRSSSLKSFGSKENIDKVTTKFRAKSPTVLYKPPFQVKLERKEPPLKQIDNFTLHTQVRVLEREEFDNRIKEKENLKQMQEKQIEEKKKLEEKLEVWRLRKEAEHKANPIRKYKPVAAIAPRPLTEPHTPNRIQRFREN